MPRLPEYNATTSVLDMPQINHYVPCYNMFRWNILVLNWMKYKTNPLCTFAFIDDHIVKATDDEGLFVVIV